MAVQPLGKITVKIPGQPVPISESPISCHSIFFQALPANLGMLYIGMAALNSSTGEGLVAHLLCPQKTYLPSFEVTVESLANGLNAADWFIASDAVGSGAQVTVVTI